MVLRMLTEKKNSLLLKIRKVAIIAGCVLSKDNEKKEIARYLLHTRSIPVHPYGFADRYDPGSVEVKKDKEGYPYVIHSGKRLYLQKGWSVSKCRRYYNNLRIEQDRECTHKYLTDPVRYPDMEDIVADIGAAEGLFALEVADRAKKLYLFESDGKWMIPLQKTFEAYRDRVVMVNKYVSASDDENSVSLDAYFAGREVTFIKADIEGAEEEMLRGAGRILASSVRKALICTYHRPGDETRFRRMMEDHGFRVEANAGYMLYIHDPGTFRYPYLRHGVLFAQKDEKRLKIYNVIV